MPPTFAYLHIRTFAHFPYLSQMFAYYHKNHTASFNAFGMLQEYALQPTLILLGLYCGMIIYVMAWHLPLLWYGIIGGIVLALLSNFFGQVNARSSYLEIGFDGDYFYMRSAYDIAYKQNLKFYPLAYANATIERDTIYLNYIDHVIRLRREEWPQWHEIWQELTVSKEQLTVNKDQGPVNWT